MKKLTVRVMDRSKLTPEIIDGMWNLYSSHYNRADRRKFQEDLERKHFAFVGRDSKTREIRGFSTADFRFYEHEGRRVGILFSGDTMIHPDYWGQKSLHLAFLRATLICKLRHPGTPIYWNLIASGYRTYLAMVRNFPTYWPRYDRATPSWEHGLIDKISRSKFGTSWDPEQGVIRMETEGVLKTEVAPFTEEVKSIPEIAYFVKKNKAYLEGTELASIAEINAAFFFQIGWKSVSKLLEMKVKQLGAPQPSPYTARAASFRRPKMGSRRAVLRPSAKISRS